MIGQEIYNGSSSNQMQSYIEKFVNDNPVEYSSLFEPLKKAANLKYKEYLKETILENQRKGNFLRIYPSRGGEMYDPFFQSPRPYNKVINKVLFRRSSKELRKTINFFTRKYGWPAKATRIWNETSTYIIRAIQKDEPRQGNQFFTKPCRLKVNPVGIEQRIPRK